MKEIWKDIEGYKGFYKISNMGNCMTFRKKGSGKYIPFGRLLTPVTCTNGYLEYQLSMNGKRKCHMAHRLVAQAFIPNPENKPEVNHKDENIQNNCIDNLEWMTSKENANYGTRNKRVSEKISVAVVQLDINNNLIKIHNSLTKAGLEMGVGEECISRVCKGKQKLSKGYKWIYYTDYLDMITRGEVSA